MIYDDAEEVYYGPIQDYIDDFDKAKNFNEFVKVFKKHKVKVESKTLKNVWNYWKFTRSLR